MIASNGLVIFNERDKLLPVPPGIGKIAISPFSESFNELMNSLIEVSPLMNIIVTL